MQRLQKEQEDAQLAEESKKKRQENAKSRTTALQDDNVRLQLEIQRLKQSMAENTKNNEKQLRDAKNAAKIVANKSKPSVQNKKRARAVSVQEESESESSANDESDEEEIVERSAKAKRGKNHRPRSFDDRQVTVREAKRIALSAVDRQRLLAYEKQDINAFVMNSFDNYF
jgi:hypothetical protein